jgi:hypothetical protein
MEATSAPTPIPPQSLATPAVVLRDAPASSQGGPIGPILAVEVVQWFSQLPKPCLVKLTYASDNQNLGRTLDWILSYGDPTKVNGGAICDMHPDVLSPPNIDEPSSPRKTTDPGIVVHWNENFTQPKESHISLMPMGFNVKVSHRLPPNSPPNLIWLDIGPGSPWK